MNTRNCSCICDKRECQTLLCFEDEKWKEFPFLQFLFSIPNFRQDITY